MWSIVMLKYNMVQIYKVVIGKITNEFSILWNMRTKLEIIK